VKKLQPKLTDYSQIPSLKRWEFTRIREKMGVYKNAFAKHVGRSESWPGKMEKHSRKDMPLKYIYDLKQMNPDLFMKALEVHESEKKNKVIEIEEIK
jgi:hypothetical protein